MIKKLHLKNFRGFESHTLSFHSTTVIVGRNNAGKSTIVEALRLLSLVSTRYRGLKFLDVPSWLYIPRSHRGVSPSLKSTEIDLTGVFHRYGNPPAQITANFTSGETVKIYLGENVLHAVIFDTNGEVITTKGEAARITLPKVSILPQISPLLRGEKFLTQDYVISAMSLSLSSLHFRNQIYLHKDIFQDFKIIAESSWSGLRIHDLEIDDFSTEQRNLSLFVQDGDFTAEVGWMGHGLQMWLQTMWFLTRTREDDTVILDEPDVYMHADLQRKLIRLLKGRYPQVIVATHSSEIMAEVEPEDILVVNRRRTNSMFAASFPAAQKVLTSMGSVHNLQLARLWTARRFLMVEGEDISFLKKFQNTLYPDSESPIDIIPSMTVGGWGGWNYAVGSSMFLENAGGEGIITYCILDSDFHTSEEINERKNEATKRNVQLHIWSKKEIENYLLVSTTIQRLIESRMDICTTPPTVDDILEQLDRIAEKLKDDTFDAISSQIKEGERGVAKGTANKRARELLNAAWETQDGRLGIVSGKEVCSRLSQWSKETYDVSFSREQIAKALRADEIDEEVCVVMEAIESNASFS